MKKNIMKDLNLDEYKIGSIYQGSNNILALDLIQATPFLDYLTQTDTPIILSTRRERFICRYIETKNGALYYEIIGFEA